MNAAVDTALIAKIKTAANFATHAPGGCWMSVRPQGSSFPVVVVSPVSSIDYHSFSDGGFEVIDYDVKVIAPISAQANVGTLSDAIHTVLERQALTITGKSHLATLRLRRIPNFVETVSGVAYIHRGATYRVSVTA
jgi:hypothetical protein